MIKGKKLALLSIIAAATLINGISFTMASFVGIKPVGYTIASNGKRNFDTIFLNPGVWLTGSGNEDFAIYTWKGGLEDKWILPVRIQESGYYTFQLDLNYYTDDSTEFFFFVRLNPDRESYGWNHDISWNKTINLTKGGYSTNNVYSINGWGTEKFCGEEYSNTISTGSFDLNVANN